MICAGSGTAGRPAGLVPAPFGALQRTCSPKLSQTLNAATTFFTNYLPTPLSVWMAHTEAQKHGCDRHVSQVEVEPAVAPRGGGGGGHGGGGGGGGGEKIMNKRTYTFVLDIVGMGTRSRAQIR